MVFPGQPVPGQKIAPSRGDGGEDGRGGTSAERAGAAPEAAAFMAAYSETRGGEGRTRSRFSNDLPEVSRQDAGKEMATIGSPVGPNGNATPADTSRTPASRAAVATGLTSDRLPFRSNHDVEGRATSTDTAASETDRAAPPGPAESSATSSGVESAGPSTQIDTVDPEADLPTVQGQARTPPGAPDYPPLGAIRADMASGRSAPAAAQTATRPDWSMQSDTTAPARSFAQASKAEVGTDAAGRGKASLGGPISVAPDANARGEGDVAMLRTSPQTGHTASTQPPVTLAQNGMPGPSNGPGMTAHASDQDGPRTRTASGVLSSGTVPADRLAPPATAQSSSLGTPDAGKIPDLVDARAKAGPGAGVKPGATTETRGPGAGVGAAAPDETGRSGMQPSSLAHEMRASSSITAAPVRPDIPGHGLTHPGQHGLDQAPGAPARANGQGQGIGLAATATGTAERAAEPSVEPRASATAPPVGTAHRDGTAHALAVKPQMTEEGRPSSAADGDSPSDLPARVGPDTAARLDGARAASPAFAGPALPDAGPTAPSAAPATAIAGAMEISGTPTAEPGATTHPGGAPVSGPAASASSHSAMPMPQGGAQTMAQTAANQIVASLPRPVSDLGTGTLEVALDPPELGRVRLSLVEVSGTLTLSITAERPETAELMRRHLDLLAQEFTRSGLDAPSVRVGAEGGGTSNQGPGADGDAGGHARAASGLLEPDTGLPLHPAPAPDPRRALDVRF